MTHPSAHDAGAVPDRGPILLCSLGVSWAVVPEAYALLAPDVLDLYRHHPQAAAFRNRISELGLEPPAEVWVLTTGGTRAEESVRSLERCWASIPQAAPLRVWIAAQTDNLATSGECELLRELTFRLCLHATAAAGQSRVVLCLAGGRKTMSADMQMAASLFGCAESLHVIDGKPLPPSLQKPAPEMLARPLPPDLAEALFPVFLGPSDRSDIVDVPDPHTCGIVPEAFPIDGEPSVNSELQAIEVRRWSSSEPLLTRTIQDRERRKASLFAGHIKAVLEKESRANWYGLYRLPVRQIEHLRRTRLQARHREWLRRLPKAELHCHLGGVLDIEGQREVARALWHELTAKERQQAEDAVSDLIRGPSWPPGWNDHLRGLTCRSEATAALLLHLSAEDLERRLYSPTEPRIALRERAEAGGFLAYELPGELSGSAILQRGAAVAEYAKQAYDRLRRDGIRYCELRGSPSKYLRKDAMRFLSVFRDGLREAQRQDPGCDVRFLVIADRRGDVTPDVHTAVEAHRALDGFVVGFDVAGDEAGGRPLGELAALMTPAFEQCLPITIHAGEGEPADNVWNSLYRLHAERLGHGLTLYDRRDLAARLRDRGIAVEMCPTSNLEVVGFRDPEDPATYECREYPIAGYLRDLVLDVVVCTDNPGLCRTDLAEEFLLASRMAGGLTLWESLAMLRAGFEHAFASAELRAELMREADMAVVAAIADFDP